MLTEQDAHNLIIFLNRVEYTGLDEARLVALLHAKLLKMKEADASEDLPTAS